MISKKLAIWLLSMVACLSWAQTSNTAIESSSGRIDVLGQNYASAPAVSARQSRVVVYSLDDLRLQGATSIFVNGTYHASLIKGAYSDLCYSPGNVELGARQMQVGQRPKDQPDTITAMPLRGGQTHYLRVREQGGRPVLEPVAAAQAERELPSKRLQLHTISRVAQDCIPSSEPAQAEPVRHTLAADNLDALATDAVTGQNGVIGNTGLTGQWDYKGQVTLTGVDGVSHTYKVYDHSTTGAQVLVDLPITVNTSTPVTITSISTDTLKLAAGTTLDLTVITNNQTVKSIQEVEIFTLQGGNSVLTASANDVLSLGGANLSGYSFTAVDANATAGGTSSTGKVQMVVNGLSGDKLVLNELFNDGVSGQNGVLGNTGLGGQWDYKGDVVKNGITYKVYDHSTTQAQVLVNIAVTVDTTSPIKISSISTDSGTSTSDFITNDQTLVYTGKLPSGFNTATEKVKVEIVNSSNAVVYSGYATVNGSNWTWDDSADTLAAGNYTIKATVVNASTGNVVGTYGANGTSSQALVVDTGVPNAGAAPTVEITTDANNDGLINATEGTGSTVAVKASWTGTVVAGDQVVITDGTTVQTVTVTPFMYTTTAALIWWEPPWWVQAVPGR